MTQPHEQFIVSHQTASLKLAPAAEMIPAPSSEPAIYAIHRRLVSLHYLALVALYGPPPAGVTVRFANVDKPLQSRRPTYIAQLAEMPSREAVGWMLAFEDGLDRWDEAEFADPLTVIPGLDDSDEAHVEVAQYEAAMVGAARRLKRSGRHQELRNMAAYLGPVMPARFNPDSPAFAEHP